MREKLSGPPRTLEARPATHSHHSSDQHSHLERWGPLDHRVQAPRAHRTRQQATSASVPRPTAESPSAARARGALARRTRPLSASRVDLVPSACQWRRATPCFRCRREVAGCFQLLRAHASIDVTVCMRNAGIMRGRTSPHAETCLHHQPRPSHAKGATPRPASQPSAAAPRDLLPALRRRRAGLLNAPSSSLRSSIRHWRVPSVSAG